MTQPQHDPPEFLEVELEGRTVLVPFEEAVASAETSTILRRQALQSAGDWLRRYAALLERIGDRDGLLIVEAITRAHIQLNESDDDEGGIVIADEE